MQPIPSTRDVGKAPRLLAQIAVMLAVCSLFFALGSQGQWPPKIFDEWIVEATVAAAAFVLALAVGQEKQRETRLLVGIAMVVSILALWEVGASYYSNFRDYPWSLLFAVLVISHELRAVGVKNWKTNEDNTDLQTMRFFGSLPPLQLRLLQHGDAVPLSHLTSDQVVFATDMVFGNSVWVSNPKLEVTGRPAIPEQSHWYQERAPVDYLEEPTEVFANGLPPTTALKLQVIPGSPKIYKLILLLTPRISMDRKLVEY